jgi:3-hydroxyacyl-[acyl-carrier-protein] dehydratase
MQFRLLDRIDEIEAGKRIAARKLLRPDEDYLRDHFPRFPVMPGVLMLEAMFQAGLWLILETEEFRRPLIMLREARNIRFADFVRPNQTLSVVAEIIKVDGHQYKMKAEGRISDGAAVNGRMTLESLSLEESYPPRAPVEGYMRHHLMEVYQELRNG